ncbi:DNA-binding protein [Mesorhizobium sp. M1A.F.Ca.IN.022.07.1.1]|uniref:helix-turn-helix domain-containing protein n=1 Tax=Mesorhizobium sp. TaxID=1871066 RepID=UPI000F76450C|nr:helix-turn-helix domain-containing protein [Mesorhizobium sp.]AZO62978.1 DNA-binding protein [Mesorhizobium sp. M1A.F.Ca.IN.022.06.1.1]RUV89130.1 DNA-binding protein [Mesorhizobium sp. M1A.F.Ca.IN.022.07.1.1]RWH32456.1 MAG: DNA-binding protein [Mesorhizobium sp.]RWH41170.1 MAG: DNA-binding protein [Mesorhizobium sp.]TIM64414.1 MAG: helix-turn-helix domain-containing protein [Mesorhizobium sp.]
MTFAPNAYTVDSFCEAYGIRRNLAYEEMKAGRLEYRKAGRKTLIRKVDADTWLDNLPKGKSGSEEA